METAKPPRTMAGRLTIDGWERPVALALVVVAVAWNALLLRASLGGWAGSNLGFDFTHYTEGARRWLELGSPYQSWALAGPFAFDDIGFLHPPIALVLFAPFTVLPAILWWLIPLSIVAAGVVSARPSWARVAVIALLCLLPFVMERILLGNSAMWVAAFVALGLRYGWPWALLAIKPTLAWLGLLGVRDRRTWIAGAVVLLACVPFGGLWLEWFTVARNFDGPPAYTLLDLPLVLIPVIAYGSVTRNQSADSTSSARTVAPFE